MHCIKLAKEAYELQQGHWEKVSMWVTLTYPKNNSYREMTHMNHMNLSQDVLMIKIFLEVCRIWSKTSETMRDSSNKANTA